MPSRSSLALAAALLVTTGGLAATSRPAAATTSGAPVVAVIDTGARATHQEFDYRGRTSPDDQFVAWWDFTSEKKGSKVLPQPGQLWDTRVADPYDTNGHGTLTAAMVGGLGKSPAKTPAALPGAKLAIARVGNAGGTIEGDLSAAIRWATDTVQADVINISIGSIVPVPAVVQSAVYRSLAYARSRGVLVAVANGNGWGNVGLVPGDPGWASWYASSPDVLAVGAAGVNGLLVSTDPEVAAVFTITGPSNTSDNGYRQSSGTSFASPYVAGFAASLITTARAYGRALPVTRLEQLLKYVASDTTIPPCYEGYGVLSQSQLPTATMHAANGTMPTRPSPDVSGTYVEQVAGTLRSAWSTGV